MVNGKTGEEIEAGLPNITGQFAVFTAGNYVNEFSLNKGAFSAENSSLNGESNIYRGNSPIYKFDASKSNSIYGASETVQMAAHFVVYWKRVE